MTTHKQIYVNLAIKDMARTQVFYRQLGFEFDAKFSNEQGACLVVGEHIFVMLLVESFFKGFISEKSIVDAKQSTEALICISCESRAEVDDLVARAVAAGGTSPRTPVDHGFMYMHGFEDLDGHIWELMYMNADAAPNA